ncbi:MAG: GIY-YIG nuclease family protein [Anaerolineae bacterium]
MFTFDSKRYPTGPGCYLMQDSKGKVIYVGKAKNVRRRLASYFQPHRKRRRTERLVERIAGIEVILVNNETEALVLENNLIKQYKPRYNRMLVPEDTGYVYIVLTNEAWPRLLPYKKYWVNKPLDSVPGEAIEKRFGPYPSRLYGDTLLAFVTENYQLRTCDILPKRVCLLYHLKRCSGPCEGFISQAAYAAAVTRAVEFLSHPQAELIAQMKAQMVRYSEQLDFERAQRIKVQVHALETMLERQIVERDVPHDQDVVYWGDTHVLVMHCKRGVLLQVSLHPLAGDPQTGAAEGFILARYSRSSPAELIVNALAHPDGVQAALTAANGYPVQITVPQEGEELELVHLAAANYAYRQARERLSPNIK